MAPILHVLRHGQGYHSSEVSGANGSQIHDPWLTDKGREQCAARCKEFERHDKVDLLLASPLRRALQTCALTFAPCLDRGMRILALPIAEEASNNPCDTGSPLEDLSRDFPNKVDFDHLNAGWYLHEGEMAVDPISLNARAAKLRRFIRDRPEKEVVLVSHGFFNHYLTGEVNERGEQTTPWWGETELRTYEFVGEGGESAMVVETEESRKGRGVEDGEVARVPVQKNKPNGFF